MTVEPGRIPLNLVTAGYDDDQWIALARDGFIGGDPVETIMTLHAWVRIQAESIRRKGSPTAKWLAGQIDELADMVKRLKAETPEDFEARMDLEHGDAMTASWNAGYAFCKREMDATRQLELNWDMEAVL